jgi:hypothetical protein
MSKRFDIATEGIRKGRKSFAVLGLRFWLIEALLGYLLKLKGISKTTVNAVSQAQSVIQLSPMLSTVLKIKGTNQTTIKLSRKDSKFLLGGITSSTAKQTIKSTTLKLKNSITTIKLQQLQTIINLNQLNHTIIQLEPVNVTVLNINT